jgi:DnaJ-class molecular chaperone
MKDYYQIFNLDNTASQEEVKKSYRLYASKFHPDKHQGDKFFEEKFKEILEAYEVLSNPEKRSKYDRDRGLKNRSEYKPEYEHQSEERTYNSYSKAESTKDENPYNGNQKQTAQNDSNIKKETPVRNFGKFVFWGGILSSFLFLLGEDTIMIYVTLINIGFWGGGLIWLIGSKFNI